MFHCAGSDCHEHEVEQFEGAASGTFTPPDHPADTKLELRLVAKDSGGAEARTSLSLAPAAVDLTFATEPAGFALTVGTDRITAPLVRRYIPGSRTSLEAPAEQSRDGSSWRLVGWTDGAAAARDVMAPDAPATYTARYERVVVVVPTPDAGADAGGPPPVADGGAGRDAGSRMDAGTTASGGNGGQGGASAGTAGTGGASASIDAGAAGAAGADVTAGCACELGRDRPQGGGLPLALGLVAWVARRRRR